MTLKPRNRESINPDQHQTKKFVMKPKLHKISIEVPYEDYKSMELKAIKNDEKPTTIIRRLIKDYIDN